MPLVPVHAGKVHHASSTAGGTGGSIMHAAREGGAGGEGDCSIMHAAREGGAGGEGDCSIMHAAQGERK